MSRFNPSILVLAIAFGILSGCERMSLVSPTGSKITLTINKTSVPINGTAEVTASVIESAGTPVQNGTVVSFTSSFGSIEPREARTEGGTARVTFTGTSSGIGKIGAFSGGATVTAELEVRVGGAAAETLRLRAEPPTIPQAGGSSVVIVTVLDVSGSPLPNASVLFTTDNGTVSPGSSTSDANGEARTTLATTRTSKVTATVAGKTGDITITLVNAPTVAITCPVATAAAPIPAGVPVTCTITATAAAGGSSISNVTVNWGDGTGEQPLGAVTGANSVSHTYTSPGSYSVTAAATDQNGQRSTASQALVVTRVTPAITISHASGTGTVNVPTSFTVTPGSNPNPPLANVTVDFGDGTTRNLGIITSATTVQRTYSTDGTFTATATATDQAGTRGSSSTQVTINRSPPPTVTFTQTSDTAGPPVPPIPESFSVSATASTGLTITSIVVTRNLGGEVLYSGSGGGSFTAVVTFNEVLNATATDSAGGTTRFQLIVK